MFVKFVLIKDGKEATTEVHISKAGKYASSLEKQGIKFRLNGVVSVESQPTLGKL